MRPILSLLGFCTALIVGSAHAADFIQFVSQPGDSIGLGESGTANPANTVYTAVQFDPGSIDVTLGQGGPTWHLHFAAATGQPFVPGAYENARRNGGGSLPSLDIGYAGRGCNDSFGRFTILELVLGAGNVVTSFAADFEQHCDDQLASLYGAVRFNSTVAYSPPVLAPVPTGFSSLDGFEFPLPAGGVASGPRIEVHDFNGNPVPGARVRFDIVDCGSFTGAQSADVVTNGNGIAASPMFSAPANPGLCNVVATLPGVRPAGTISLAFRVESHSNVPIPNVQDMWWAGPPGNGWGLSLVQHRDTLFGALYIYDASGKPTWLVMPGGAWDATNRIYAGSLYTPSGAPFFAYDAARIVVGNAKGSMTLTLQDNDHAVLDYTIDGIAGRKLITREIFASGGATSPDHSDLWWGGLAQSGWGITILQQGSTLFPIWYTYDASGAAAWYVMPDGAWTSSDTYEGHVYRTTGSPWIGRDYDPTKLQVFAAGTFRIRFNGDAATFDYTVDGHTGTMPLTREAF